MRVFDIVEYPNEMSDELCHRFPEAGDGRVHTGTLLIVRDRQVAVVSLNGKLLDVFGSGRHKIAADNLPLYIKSFGELFDKKASFPADIFFISISEILDIKWGTSSPIIVGNLRSGATYLDAWGKFSFFISSPQKFASKFAGVLSKYNITGEIITRLRVITLSALQEELSEFTSKGDGNLLDAISHLKDTSAKTLTRFHDEFEALGISPTHYLIEGLRPKEISEEKLPTSIPMQKSSSDLPNIQNKPPIPIRTNSGILRVFLCHSSSDKPYVQKLYQRLKSDNFDPWLDEENLLPGQDWKLEIPKAVRKADIVIVCLSRNSVTKAGYVQKEIKDALDIADEQPEGTIFLIPLKLEECEVPDRLSRWQWVNYFDENGYKRLLNTLHTRAGTG